MEPGRDSHEDDEPVVEIVAAFETGSEATTAAPARGRTEFLHPRGAGPANVSRQPRNETYGRLIQP